MRSHKPLVGVNKSETVITEKNEMLYNYTIMECNCKNRFKSISHDKRMFKTVNKIVLILWFPVIIHN